MWKKLLSRTKICSALLALCLLFAPSVTYAATISTPTLTPEQSITLSQVLTEQERALEEALSLLDEAEIALEESETELNISLSELAQAKQELIKQKLEIKKLQATLGEQKLELESASASIANANKLLAQAKAEMEVSEKKHTQKENSLRGERAFYQVLCIILGGVAAVK